MKKMVLFLFVLIVSLCNINYLYSTEKGDTLKKVERPASLPKMNLFPDYSMKIYYENDNQFQLSEEDYKKIFVIAEYLIANPERSVYMISWQHENEEKGTTKKRIDYIRDKMVEIGAKPDHIFGKPMRALIPQNDDDIFTPEELVNARRIDIKIIR